MLKLQTRECNFFVYQTADCVGTKYKEHESEQQDPEALTGVSTGCSLLAEEVEGKKKKSFGVTVGIQLDMHELHT